MAISQIDAETKSLLRFITCGSVDDGKSTLLGHLLYAAKLLYTDQVTALVRDSQHGSVGGAIDYSLLLDGLMAEREQGITIDVAYRYFTTDRRSFIAADCPGHVQYTRNMAVGASFAELALIIVDASNGIVTQTMRHIRICAMMGIKHVILAVNKMDLVNYDRHIFNGIERGFKHACNELDFTTSIAIPVSATVGDNITELSPNTPWYRGTPLLEYLETINISYSGADDADVFVMPVQRVSRPDSDFRGFQGEISTGKISTGDEITVLPVRETAKIAAILIADKKAQRAACGQAVTLTLDREIDVSRGCVIVKNTVPEVSSMLNANLLWLDDVPLSIGRSYLLKCAAKTIPATVMRIKHKVDINTGENLIPNLIAKNDIACCELALNERIVFDSFRNSKELGGFILIDRVSNQTAACGTINHSLRRANNLFWQQLDITRQKRAQQKRQKPMTLWFTGLSGSGKSTLANAIEKRLFAKGMHTMLLDGDNIRQGLNKNLSFAPEDRTENIRRIAEVAKLMNEAGLIVLTAFISPNEGDREMAREIIGESYFEVYVSTPLEICEQRDTKGLYEKARSGEITNFTGISAPYELPAAPDIVIDTSQASVEENTDGIMSALEAFIFTD